MESRLDQLPDLGFEDEPIEHIKVALTTFAFKNAKIIELLFERGDIIKNENWEEMESIERRINKVKEENYDELTIPCSAFMTFENEEGVNRARQFNEQTNDGSEFEALGKWFGKYEIAIEEASEPSDIIWENRQVTDRQRLKKKIIVFLSIFLLLLTSFGLIFICAEYSLQIISVYPDVVCEDLADFNTKNGLEKSAIREWTINHELAKKPDVDVSY